MPIEELRKRVGYEPRVFARVERLLLDENVVAEDGPRVRLPNFSVVLSDDEQRLADALLGALAGTGASPPSRAELKAQMRITDDVIQALVDRGDVIEVGPDLVYRAADYDAVVANIVELLRASGSITVAQVRDRFATSRKYALALLEHLDERRVTRRTGDARVLH
jgi:selenocysteine-specific elongation factor